MRETLAFNNIMGEFDLDPNDPRDLLILEIFYLILTDRKFIQQVHRNNDQKMV